MSSRPMKMNRTAKLVRKAMKKLRCLPMSFIISPTNPRKIKKAPVMISMYEVWTTGLLTLTLLSPLAR